MVKQWPKRLGDKKLVLSYLASKFEFGYSYHEREINEMLNSGILLVTGPCCAGSYLSRASLTAIAQAQITKDYSNALQ